ncbi:cullin-3A-like protein [Tanacetum coccineum]
MTSHLEEIALSIEDYQGALFLQELDRKWTEHNKALQMIRDILLYMERTFIPSTQKTPVHELGLKLWRDNIVHSIKIQTRLKDTLAEIVQKERGGEVISSRGVMRNIVRMLTDLGHSAYEEAFENPFLAVSADFYRAESQLLIESCDCGEYLKKAEKLLNEEIKRVSHYLGARSKVKITNVMEKVVIESHMTRLVNMENSGLVAMLLDDKYDDLGRMYNLFRRVPNGLTVIRDAMTSHLREFGSQLMCDPERLKNPLDFIQCLLDEKDKHDKIINVAFNNDDMFQKVVSSSFEYFINLNTRSPEFVSLFVDDKLRKVLKWVSEEDVEIVLDKVLMLFRYLEEKDVFEKYYRQHLAKRLLYANSVSEDAERSFILKLKAQCGQVFTSNLEGMFLDIKTSDDTMQGFYAAMGHELGDGPALAVRVLTIGSWPTQSTAACNLPPEILRVCNKFKAYYLGAHNGRRLTWQTSLGSAVLKATFGSGRKHELHVSTYQMCVLMLFNNGDGLSYREVEQATEIPTSDLKRCLKILACAKHKNVLTKEPASEEIGEEDTFFFNEKFASKHFKVDIGAMVVEMESESEKKETKQKVEKDRKPQIEAAIVRIMKARQVLDHNNLVAEVTKLLQTRFLPNPADIKKRVEDLILRDFLERDQNDRNLYRYMA